MSGLLLTLANPKPHQLNRLGTEIKALLQNTDNTDYKLVSFDYPSQELIFAAVYNSAEYCRFESKPPDPLATEAGRFVLLGNSANGTDAHSLLAKQFGISRANSKTLGLSLLYSSGVTSCCNLLRPSLGNKYNDKELKKLVTEYQVFFKGTKARGDYLYSGGLFSYFFNYISWLIAQPVPRLQYGNQAITNTLRPEICGADFFTSRANWPVQGMGSAVLDSTGYEIDKLIYSNGLEDFVWYQQSCHDALSYMAHNSAVEETISILKTAYEKVWVKFFKAFNMTPPPEVIKNLQINIDIIDRKEVNTSVLTASGKPFLNHIPDGKNA